MKPEIILQSDVLDILFENRNKAYGAYALRKNYNRRLMQALGGTGLFVLLFIALQSMKPKNNISGPIFGDTVEVSLVDPPRDRVKPVEPARPKQPVRSTVNDNIPVIKPDSKVPETKIPTQEDITNGNPGTKTVDGPGSIDPGPAAPGPAGVAPAEPKPEQFDEVTVRVHPDVMPAFTGDIVKYMLRNLRQPDDLEDGQKIVVKVKFVVTKEGEISDVEVIQSGRPDLDNEVMRVVKKMPRWKPGMQGGRNVPVYFNLPVTFVSNTE